MIYDVDKFTDFIIKMQLTPTQFFICWLLERNDVGNLKRYIDAFGKLEEKDLEYLIVDKGYIVNTAPQSRYLDVNSLFVSIDFKESILIDEDEAFEQLRDAYPKYVQVNGTKFPSTGLTLSDHTVLNEMYAKEIKNNKFRHEQILNLVEKWKETVGENAPFKIDKFITSKYWKELEIKKDERPRIY